MAGQGLGTFPMMFATMAGYGDVAQKLDADLKAGAITIAEGVDLAVTLAPHIEGYLPAEEKPVVEAVLDLVVTAYGCEQTLAPKIVALQAALKAATPPAAVPAK